MTMNKQIYIEAIGIVLLGVIISVLGHYTHIASMDTIGDLLMGSGAAYLGGAFRFGNLTSSLANSNKK